MYCYVLTLVLISDTINIITISYITICTPYNICLFYNNLYDILFNYYTILLTRPYSILLLLLLFCLLLCINFDIYFCITVINNKYYNLSFFYYIYSYIFCYCSYFNGGFIFVSFFVNNYNIYIYYYLRVYIISRRIPNTKSSVEFENFVGFFKPFVEDYDDSGDGYYYIF